MRRVYADQPVERLPRAQAIGYVVGLTLYWGAGLSRMVVVTARLHPGEPIGSGPSALLWMTIAGSLILVVIGYHLAKAGLVQRLWPQYRTLGRVADWIAFCMRVLFGYFVPAAFRGLRR
jgi:hypothetical protein